MKITEDYSPARYGFGKRLMIEIDEGEVINHKESTFELEARKVYEKTKTISDMLFYLSEWAKTEEEINSNPTNKE